MRSSIAPVFLLPILGACAFPAPYGPAGEPAASEAGSGRTVTATPPSTAAAAPQDTDYSLTALYLNAHADFQHKSRPYLFQQRADPFVTPLRASYRYQGQTEVDGEPGDLEWQQYDFNALVPIPVDRDVAVLVGGNFEARNYDFDNIAGAAADDRYYRIDAQMGATWFVHDDLSITGLFSPGVYSDLDGTLNHDDWYFFGSLLGTYKASDSLFYKVGVATDETFDDVPVFPLLGLSCLLAMDWRLDILLPWGATVSWLPADATTISAGLELMGAAYNIRTPPLLGTKIETENRIQELSLFLGVDHRFTEELSAFGRFGTLLAGDYDIRVDVPGAKTDGQIEPALFFEVGLGWKF